jgi:signal transduction histidine kinase
MAAPLEQAAFAAMSDAVLAIAAERSVDTVLRKLVEAARRLSGARYAAIGVPDGEGGFAKFITAGMSERQIEELGPLPRTHGLLGAMLETTEPYRTDDIREDPRFVWWPDAHPVMHTFLGVPIVSGGEVSGAFYLTNKRGGRRTSFTDADERLLEVLASHAAVAIENARLHERSRELTVVEERNRLARELHDAAVQTIFSVSLTAEAAAALVDRDPAQAKAELRHLQELARTAMDELRSLVFELRPADLESDGLVPTLRKHVAVLERVHGTPIELAIDGERRLPRGVEAEVFRIAQEALTNALRHAGAARVAVSLALDGSRLELAVRDDGCGFVPERARGRHLGLVSMEERAARLGGRLAVESRPGAGTTVRLEAPA